MEIIAWMLLTLLVSIDALIDHNDIDGDRRLEQITSVEYSWSVAEDTTAAAATQSEENETVPSYMVRLHVSCTVQLHNAMT